MQHHCYWKHVHLWLRKRHIPCNRSNRDKRAAAAEAQQLQKWVNGSMCFMTCHNQFTICMPRTPRICDSLVLMLLSSSKVSGRQSLLSQQPKSLTRAHAAPLLVE